MRGMTAQTDQAATQESPQRKQMGVWVATGLVAGTMIGSGVFLLPASLAAYGSVSLVAFAITAAGSLALALTFASLARRIPETGGPYAFARSGFGDFLGFQTAWNYWIGLWVSVGAIAVALVGYVGSLAPAVADNRALEISVAVGAVALLTAINLRGVAAGGLVTAILTLLKAVPLLLLGIAGLFALNPDNLQPFIADGYSFWGAIAACLPLTLFAFIGLESACVPADDVHEPEKTIPRATILGTLGVAALYLLSTFSVFGTVPRDDLVDSSAPLADSAEIVWGPWAGTAMSVVAVISCAGAMLGLILIQSQVPMAAARDHLFPSRFQRLNPKGVPVIGLLVSSGLAVIVIVMNFSSGELVDVYNTIVLLATVATLVPYAFSAGAELVWSFATRHAVPLHRLVRNGLIAGLGFVYSVVAIAGAGQESVYAWMMLFLLGVPAYVWTLRSDLSRQTPA
jgi:APA family basic amino acid/polyamine antiporter